MQQAWLLPTPLWIQFPISISTELVLGQGTDLVVLMSQIQFLLGYDSFILIFSNVFSKQIPALPPQILFLFYNRGNEDLPHCLG